MTPILPPLPNGSVVTVGSFDGVHLGHQAVLGEIGRRAAAAGRPSVLVTFEPHPLEVVNPHAAPQVLTTGPERREILAQTDLEYAVFLRFDRGLAELSPTGFVREILVGRCQMKELVIGHDHGFGRGRTGDVETLRQLGVSDGFDVDVIAPVEIGGHPISSTQIRRAVAGGDLRGAALLLGRPYHVSGRIVRGVGRGKTIGVPTANVGAVPGRKLLPPDGVYAAWVEWRGGRYGAMMNQGTRPTFSEHLRLMEVHLFDFSGDLYDEWVKVEWIERLRDVKRFASAAELKDQLQFDREQAVAVLAASEAGARRVSHG
jgi:riboflavin kinase/FMN adenylyltransferase